MKNDFFVIPDNDDNNVKVNKFIDLFMGSCQQDLKDYISEIKNEYNLDVEWKMFLLGDSEEKGIFRPLKSPFIAVSNIFIVFGDCDFDVSSDNIKLMGYSSLLNPSIELYPSDSCILFKNDTLKFVFSLSGFDGYGSVIDELNVIKEDFKSYVNKKESDKLEMHNTKRAELLNSIKDSRFSSSEYIISKSDIPEGFAYLKPFICTYTTSGVLANSSKYIKCFEAINDTIIDSIDNGEFDALFNVSINIQSVEHDFDMVLTGDAVKVNDR